MKPRFLHLCIYPSINQSVRPLQFLVSALINLIILQKNWLEIYQIMLTCVYYCSIVIRSFGYMASYTQSKKISNDQELIQSDPISCPQSQKGNN